MPFLLASGQGGPCRGCAARASWNMSQSIRELSDHFFFYFLPGVQQQQQQNKNKKRDAVTRLYTASKLI